VNSGVYQWGKGLGDGSSTISEMGVHFSCQEMIVYASTCIPWQQGEKERIWGWGSPSSHGWVRCHCQWSAVQPQSFKPVLSSFLIKPFNMLCLFLWIFSHHLCLQCFDAVGWVVGCWCGYLSGWGTDLHMAQLTPLQLTVSYFSKIQIGVTFLVLAHLGSPSQTKGL